MKPFALTDIQILIDQALQEQPTGDAWLDARYAEQQRVQGHTQPYYKLFYLLARTLRPGFVVELGSFQATGAAHFAAGNPEGLVITIDIHKDDKAAQQACYEAERQYANLAYMHRWTWDAVDDVAALKRPIDILYIDAWHEYQYARRERDLYTPLLASPALVVCDDILENGGIFAGMEQFWAEMPEPKFLNGTLHNGIPMGFVYVG